MLRIPLVILTASMLAAAEPPEELRVKREAVFEFAATPQVTRDGDRVTIAFATKGLCDVTVAIEDDRGRIVRHLASGVLGANAPEPFRKNSKAQRILWDGKDDAGRYIDNKDALTVRVSLGLRPRFERTLFWSPHKRIGSTGPILCVAREGVYVGQGYAVDHVRLFDHDGNYVRTVYPFPAGRLDAVLGLRWHAFAQDGRRRPLKHGYHQATLLTSGTNTNPRSSAEGYAATAIAAQDRRVALVFRRLNRLAADGATGGLPMTGPETTYRMMLKQKIHERIDDFPGPRSAAFSPDGKRLYLTGYVWHSGQRWTYDWLHAVTRLDFEKDDEPTLFAGSLKQDDVGTDNTKFTVPTSVACDAKGRVYVSDYINDRIQVFTPDGKHFKTIQVFKPARVDVHRRTGEIYVFSWLLITRYKTPDPMKATYTRLGPVENPRVIVQCKLPLRGYRPVIDWNSSGGLPFRMAVDSWADEPTVWIVPGAPRAVSAGSHKIIIVDWEHTGIRKLVERDGELVVERTFDDDVKKTVVRPTPPILWRQRLCVNPATGKLYVAEGDSGVMKSVNQLVEIDPRTGKTGLLDLPMGAEDLCFGRGGLAYLRTDQYVVRYDSRTWKEVPFDYGQAEPSHGWGMGARSARLISALRTPGHRSNPFWHLGGMDVSVKGHIVVSTCNRARAESRSPLSWQKNEFKYRGTVYTPKVFPGRALWGEVHVWDRHGNLLCEDAVPGMAHMNGIGIDADDNLYMMAAARRLIRGKGYDLSLGRDVTCTVIKTAPRKAKVLASTSRAPVPLPGEQKPPRPPDVTSRWTGGAWVENAQWLFGGVGFNPRGCICWNCRFDLDYFNRTFAPEPLSYSVAVLDSAGNLILRLGRYGNVDDGLPLHAAGGPRGARSVGGDEVALMHACYVATDTDRRLFIADAGNARILSVKLDYHHARRIALKDVGDGS